ncbi:MAG TPA: hypothetical protein VIK01_04650, partial [Polyangiaceae bacterium]
MGTRPNVVWILGSGFSRSLGGPLLYDLLSELGSAETAARFPTLKMAGVYNLFEMHRAGSLRQRPPYWKHAEEFLSFVDGAVPESSNRHKIVKELITPWASDETPLLTPESFRDRCAQAIAAECLFTLGAKPLQLETWAPYLQWACFRSDNDTIITFNYDLVLETIGSIPDIRSFGAPSVLIPDPNGTLQGLRGAAGVTNILKMHGSVDWVDAGGKIERKPDVEATLRSGQVPLIGTPGPTKSLRRNGHFAPIWNEAEDRLRAADVIVFMGYRFPPSDSEARSAILRAIRENIQPYLRVRTVLGPRTGEDDTVRLQRLLTLTLQGAGRRIYSGGRDMSYDLIAETLYAEDLMSTLTN